MASGTRVGTVIENKYRLEEQIGHGGMGAVYRGVQLAVDRPVAVKLLHPNFVGHDKLQARFEVEAKAIARLNHPNCITLFDFGYSEEMGAFYTVVEFIDGTPLESLIPQRTPVARVVDLVRQIASALGHAHHHGILHRDLKPENIMVARMTDGSDMVKVLDFGIAQIMKGSTDQEGDDDDFEADRLTRVGEVFGTPPYMSPEQAMASRDLTPAADLYALGIIFYELLEGRLPFFADNPMEILGMHLNEPPPPLKRIDAPQMVKEVVLSMLEKKPENRPQSGGKVIELLDRIPADQLSVKSPAVKVPGQARPSEPTLLEAPDSPPLHTGPVDRASTFRSVAEPESRDLEASSVILDLEDIVPEDQMPPHLSPPAAQQRISAPADATGTLSAATVETAAQSGGSTRSTTTDLALKQLNRGALLRNLFVFLTIFLLLATVAGYWYVSQNDTVPNDEERVSSTLAATAADEDAKENDSAEAGEDPLPSEDSSELAREVSIGEVAEEIFEDESAEVGEEARAREEEVAPRRATSRQPTPQRTTPREQPRRTQPEGLRLQQNESEEDGPRRPARLGL